MEELLVLTFWKNFDNAIYNLVGKRIVCDISHGGKHVLSEKWVVEEIYTACIRMLYTKNPRAGFTNKFLNAHIWEIFLENIFDLLCLIF